jgi:hypothetical protein
MEGRLENEIPKQHGDWRSGETTFPLLENIIIPRHDRRRVRDFGDEPTTNDHLIPPQPPL